MIRMMQDVTMASQSDLGKLDMYNVDSIFKLAEEKYKDLVASGKWSGAKSKGKTSVFMTTPTKGNGKSKTRCFNCGKDHLLPKSPEPLDQARINANKAKFEASKKSGSSSPSANVADKKPKDGKFRPPEANENNRRLIDGKPMFYNKRTKRWVPDRNHTTAQSANNAATSSSTESAPKKSVRFDASSADAALANTSRAIDSAFRGLLYHFKPE